MLAVGYWLAYGDPSSSRLGIVCKQSLLSLRSVGWLFRGVAARQIFDFIRKEAGIRRILKIATSLTQAGLKVMCCSCFCIVVDNAYFRGEWKRNDVSPKVFWEEWCYLTKVLNRLKLVVVPVIKEHFVHDGVDFAAFFFGWAAGASFAEDEDSFARDI